MEDKRNLNVEDTTKYGEFISSFDGWQSFEEQKRRVNHLENNTKKCQIK